MRDDRVRRVQRPTDALPVVHLESEVPRPPAGGWSLTVDGRVGVPTVFGLDDLVALGRHEVSWDFHCVWGWSRPGCVWSGTTGAAVAEAVGLVEDFVVVSAVGGVYASALTREEFAAGLFATHLDGQPLAAEHGGPLRFVPPPGKWAFKGVKWAARVTGTPVFTPGYWESVVGNPRGDMPLGREELRYER